MKYQLDDVHAYTQSLHWIGTELCDPPRYDGLTDIILFLKAFEL
jgi:hypothetical protein